jgi:hypothetical protein
MVLDRMVYVCMLLVRVLRMSEDSMCEGCGYALCDNASEILELSTSQANDVTLNYKCIRSCIHKRP